MDKDLEKNKLPEEYLKRSSKLLREKEAEINVSNVPESQSKDNLSVKEKIEELKKRPIEPLEKQPLQFRKFHENIALGASASVEKFKATQPPAEKMRKTIRGTITSMNKLALRALKNKKKDNTSSFFKRVFGKK